MNDDSSNIIRVSFRERRVLREDETFVPRRHSSMDASGDIEKLQKKEEKKNTSNLPHQPEPTQKTRAQNERRSLPAPRMEDASSSYYTIREAAKILQLPETKLRYWARSEFLSPSVRSGRRRFYTFQDLVSLRTARDLSACGIPLKELRTSIDALRKRLGSSITPLVRLRVSSDGKNLFVRDDEVAFDAKSGQILFDFEVQDLSDAAIEVLGSKTNRAQRKIAYEFYLEGCRLDDDYSQTEKAAACYRRAIAADPSMGHAYTNLGNLLFRQNRPEEAKEQYRAALQVDPEQPEALYNLGCLALEAGDSVEATFQLEQAVAIDPGFADGHFNLALSYEFEGRISEARQHWNIFLELEPTGVFAEQARRKLNQLDQKL